MPHDVDVPQPLLDLYDAYAHSQIDRREFVRQAGKFTVGGLTGAALLQLLMPNYALANQVAPDDARIMTDYLSYESPAGYGKMRGYQAQPATREGKLPAVLVVHENRGLNPYIEDVVRRLAVAGFLAFGPDALTPLGGYPGNDDDGRTMQKKLDTEKIVADFVAAAELLLRHPQVNGKLGVVGFCFGGWMANTLAVRLGDRLRAAVPFYGRPPDAADAAKIKASLLLHFAGNDERVNAGWPDWEAALKQHQVHYQAHLYPEVNHGFHNDTTPRYDEAAAVLAWQRTIAFFREQLG